MKNIFVGNLSLRTSEDDLRSLFKLYGNVQQVKLVTDRGTGRSRGFAFVEMGNDGEAQRAITVLNGKPVDGKNVKVNEARQKGEPPFDNRPTGQTSSIGLNKDFSPLRVR